MMAQKAELFGDKEIHKQILDCDDPAEIKKLGRRVRKFDASVWDQAKYSIVLNGNWMEVSAWGERCGFEERAAKDMRKYTVQRITIPSGNYGMRLIILRPAVNRQPREKTPGILWIHGGGYALGMAAMVFMSRAKRLVTEYGAVVIAPEYRLAGKAPYPAALEDCYQALLYLKAHAAALGCADDRIMVGGESAGGGLTAALCMLARDRGEVKIAFQMPLYPMLDHRDTASSRNNHGISWNTKRNHAAWKLYLREIEGEIPPYASPARQTDYSSLPPAYTFVGDREPFYCETLTYVENLKKAGVPARVDVYPTGFHAFDMLLPFCKISRRAIAAFEKQYLYAAEEAQAAQND